MTSSGDASSSASWTIAATRTPPRSTAVHARPEPGSGSSHRAAGVVDEDLALGQPVGDVQRAVAEALGQHLAHRPALGHARAQQRGGRARAAPRRRPRARRSRRSSPAARAGTARGRPPGRAPTGRRAARPRPPSPLTPSPASAIASSDGQAGRRPGPRSATGSLSRSIPAARQNAPVAELRADAACRAAAAATGGRCVSSRRLACRRSPSASRHVSRAVPGEDRQPDPQRREQHAEHEPAADHQQVGQALAEARRPGTAARGGRRAGAARGRARRSRRGLDRDVAARAQRLDLERRVGGVGEPADADRAGVALRVDLVAAGRDDRAHVAGCASAARAGRRSTPRARATPPVSELARSGKPQKPVAAIVPEPVLIWTEARTPARLTVPLEVSISSGTLSGTREPVARAAGAEHLVRAARDDRSACRRRPCASRPMGAPKAKRSTRRTSTAVAPPSISTSASPRSSRMPARSPSTR